MDELLRHILGADPAPAAMASVAAAWTEHRALGARFTRPVEHAVAAGFGADRLGYAFLSGYRAALQQLLPDLPIDRTVALCATEKGGGHPRAIETRLVDDALTGTKTFVTMGAAAELLVVVATEGDGPDGRPLLRAVIVPAASDGVTLTDRPPLPFAPEVPHAIVELAGVRVADVLPGDAYVRYLKPFRTIEDVHVLAAVVGWLCQVARRSDWPASALERLVHLATAVCAVADLDPVAPATHISLGALQSLMTDSLTEFESLWASVDAATRERWERDRALLSIASGVRAKRLESAWQAFAPR